MGRQVMFLFALAGGGFFHAGTQATEGHEPDVWTSAIAVRPSAPRLECEATSTADATRIRAHDDCVDVDPHEVDARTSVDGPTHSLAVTDDGRLFAWGDNGDGQLGTGAIGGHFHRPQPIRGRWRSDAGSIAAGARHSVAIRDDGTVSTWGHDRGCDGASRGAGLPRTVVFADGTPLRDVIAVSAGHDVSYALTRDGSAWSWGATPLSRMTGRLPSFVTPSSDPAAARRLAAR
jgi:hypothetical protein